MTYPDVNFAMRVGWPAQWAVHNPRDLADTLRSLPTPSGRHHSRRLIKCTHVLPVRTALWRVAAVGYMLQLHTLNAVLARHLLLVPPHRVREAVVPLLLLLGQVVEEQGEPLPGIGVDVGNGDVVVCLVELRP